MLASLIKGDSPVRGALRMPPLLREGDHEVVEGFAQLFQTAF